MPGLKIYNVEKPRKYQSKLNVKKLEAAILEDHALEKEEQPSKVQKMFVPAEKKLKALAGHMIPLEKVAAGVAVMIGQNQYPAFTDALRRAMRIRP